MEIPAMVVAAKVPHNKISIQLYTLRDAMEEPADFDLVMRTGCRSMDTRKSNWPATPEGRDGLGTAVVPRRPRDVEESSSHDGLSKR